MHRVPGTGLLGLPTHPPADPQHELEVLVNFWACVRGEQRALASLPTAPSPFHLEAVREIREPVSKHPCNSVHTQPCKRNVWGLQPQTKDMKEQEAFAAGFTIAVSAVLSERVSFSPPSSLPPIAPSERLAWPGRRGKAGSNRVRGSKA